MPGVIFKSQDDFDYVAKAARIVHRGAQEHPFHRARWPILYGDELFLLKSAETAKVLGARGTGGIDNLGEGWVVDPVTQTYDTSANVDIDLTHLNGLVFPNGDLEPQHTCWCIRRGDVYFAVSGGATFFTGETADADGLVTPGEGFTGDDIECSIMCEEVIPSGTEVGVILSGENTIILSVCCPPDEPEE